MVNPEYLGLSPLNSSKRLKLKSAAWTLTWVFHCCGLLDNYTIFFLVVFSGFRIMTSIITFIVYKKSRKHFDQESRKLVDGFLKKNSQLELCFYICMFGRMIVLETFLNCTYFAQGSRSPVEVTFRKWSIGSI